MQYILMQVVKRMPTNKPRFTVTMSDEMLQQIDDFKFANRYKTQNQAVIALVRRGIEELERQDADKKNAPPSPDVSKLEERKPDRVEQLQSALVRAGIIAPGEDLTQADADFLFGIFLALKAHFDQRQERGK